MGWEKFDPENKGYVYLPDIPRQAYYWDKIDERDRKELEAFGWTVHEWYAEREGKWAIRPEMEQCGNLFVRKYCMFENFELVDGLPTCHPDFETWYMWIKFADKTSKLGF